MDKLNNKFNAPVYCSTRTQQWWYALIGWYVILCQAGNYPDFDVAELPPSFEVQKPRGQLQALQEMQIRVSSVPTSF
jgi:hypothetical protein